MRAWLAVSLPLLVGCGSSGPVFPSDDIAEPTDTGTPDRTLPTEASTFDVVEEDSTKFNGGGPFDCLGCTCDGTLNLCAEISGGKMPLLDAGLDAGASDANACDPEASACVQIPIECLPKPTCECVMQKYNAPCTCDVDPSGNGLVVQCVYP